MTTDQDPARQDTTAHRDIAHRLTAAADEVEIGIAPYQAVMRGGRRRKTRRWVVGALAAVAIAGSTGSLALAVVDGESRTRPAALVDSAEARHVYAPQVTPLTKVLDKAGKEVAGVELRTWGAPLDASEARGQERAMREAGVWDERTTDPVPALNRPWHAIVVKADGKEKLTSFGLQDKEPGGDDGLSFASVEIEVKGEKLMIGHVGPKTKRVELEHEHGTTEPHLRRAAGSAYLWFITEEGDGGPDGKLVTVRLYDGEGRVSAVVKD
ncbi:hypothetical protein DMA15_10530 [Streptomyces sp. WAC 01529]|uniref:hypothetical protein n=1 Tax=Streptomyces sp. WAC 01529 TaxID=2203205 RepID=UPI000F6FC265|nr:hypothetical protein [Streptomyces sp. WAC 01529]AZM52977.1 hypothetical protein DMA15_10530 [Streptomyces sp. WAC 01529]